MRRGRAGKSKNPPPDAGAAQGVRRKAPICERLKIASPLSALFIVKVETYPLIIGIIVALLGIGIIFDAWTPDAASVSQERRRRPRIERHRNGEALIGFGVLALAAAFLGRDNWSYSVLVVIIGAVFLLVGAILNRSYVRELFVNRGPLRRREVDTEPLAGRPANVAPKAPADTPLPPPKPVQEEASWAGAERRKAPRGGERGNTREGPTSEQQSRH